MRVLLAEQNPHPFPGGKEYVYADWWGREIEVGGPKITKEEHACGTPTIWPITGPREFLDLLRENDIDGRYVCIHAINIKVPCPNQCGRQIATFNILQHLEACSEGSMTVDTKQDYVCRMLAEGKTEAEIAAALYVQVGTVRQKLSIMRMKWGAATTAQLMVILAREGQV